MEKGISHETTSAVDTLETPSIPESANADLGDKSNSTKQIVDATSLMNEKTPESATPVAQGRFKRTFTTVFQVALRMWLLLVRTARVEMLALLAWKAIQHKSPLFIYGFLLLALFAEALITHFLSTDAKNAFTKTDTLFDILLLFTMLAIFTSGGLNYSTLGGSLLIVSFSEVIVGLALRFYNQKKTPRKEIVDRLEQVKLTLYLFPFLSIVAAFFGPKSISFNLFDLTFMAVIFCYLRNSIKHGADAKMSNDKLWKFLKFVFVWYAALIAGSLLVVLAFACYISLGQTANPTPHILQLGR